VAARFTPALEHVLAEMTLQRFSLNLISLSVVMPALVAGIHVLLSGARRQRKTWMAGTSPAMTWRGDA